MPTVQYITQEGEEREWRPRVFFDVSFATALHQKVEVVYNPQQPQRAMILHAAYRGLRRFLLLSSVILAGVTVLLCWLTWQFPAVFPWSPRVLHLGMYEMVFTTPLWE